MNFKYLPKLKTKLFLVFIILILVLLYFPIVISPFQKPNITTFPNTYSLSFNPLNHFRQSLNNCGSYSVAGVLNVFSDNLVEPEKIANSIGFKIQDRLTFPIGIENYLKDRNMQIETPNAISLNESEKINFLKSQLSSGKAGILLVKIPQSDWYYLHYITILGYDESNFYVYDSLAPRDGDSKYTIDQNGLKPGNKSIPSKELIQIWDAGNILNYPKNYNLFTKPE
jgi:hypothetical protein